MSPWTAQYDRAYGENVPDDPDELDGLSIAELTEQALAAEPFDPFAPGAVPFGTPDDGVELLPSWYMPAPSLRRSRTRTVVFAGIVFSLLVIDVMGLCVTYGFPDPVWK